MKEKTKQVTTIYLDIDLTDKLKTYCMYSKSSFSKMVEKLLTDFYNGNKDDIDTKNSMYEDLIKKIG